MVWESSSDCMCVFIAYRLMELRLNEPDFLLRVVQMIRSLKRKRERSFLPPTVFYKDGKERREAQEDLILDRGPSIYKPWFHYKLA